MKFKLSKASKADKTKFEKLKSFTGRVIKKKETNSSSKKLNTANKGSDLIDKSQKTIIEKMKSCFSFCTRKKNKDNPKLEKLKSSKDESKEQVKSLRRYIKQKLKWVILSLFIYIIIFGGVLSIPFIVNHFRVISQNQTKKERFITRKFLSRTKELKANRLTTHDRIQMYLVFVIVNKSA